METEYIGILDLVSQTDPSFSKFWIQIRNCFTWYLYKMVTQIMLRTHNGK